MSPLLQDFIEHAPRDAVALVCKGERYTYGELDDRANALAHTLAASGVERGDRVLVFADNSAATVIAFWAVLKASAVVSIVNPLTKADKLAYLIKDCRPKVLIADAHLAPAFEGAPVRVILTAAWNEVASAPPPRRCIDVDLAAIIYTSGSTGEPKGVMLTHRNMLTATASITTLLELRHDDIILGVLPLAFNYGLYQMIMAFALGARLVLEKSFAYPAQVLSIMAKERVTGFPGVPTIYAMLSGMTDVSAFDLSAVRYVTNTAAALTAKHITLLQRVFPSAQIYSMYGLTECKRCTWLPPKDLAKKPESVGIAIPNTELWIVDENDRRVGPNVVGQLVIRGGTVMRGYWEKPNETAQVLRPGPLPGEQVLYTGDLCRTDDDGYVYFVGRMDDIIKTRAEKVAPKEVESAIVDIPGVKEVAVIGVPDDVLGQAIKAFVVRDAGATLTERDIILGCQRRLEAFMVPKHVTFLTELPKTTTGKITKTGLV